MMKAGENAYKNQSRPIAENVGGANIQSEGHVPVQPKYNHTGMPDNLKAGIENLSGHSMDDVKVHYNSAKPAQLHAHAYAQGTDIHVAPGRERHLPHEAWHVVQQKQGRVKANRQLKGKTPLNDDAGLEHEADTMGQKALQMKAGPGAARQGNVSFAVVQRNSFEDYDTYDEAKNENIYSRAALDKQKDDRIEKHFQKGFGPQEQIQIYRANKAANHDEIVSDGDGVTKLHKQNTKLVPHIDHRFPKSRGGSNHYTNAAVLAADKNLKKSNKLELGEEPDRALKPYRMLGLTSAFDDHKVGAGREFTSEQRKEILDANKAHYGVGSYVSDEDGATQLGKYDTTRIPHIDHITPKGEGGTNFYFNAQVLPASVNIGKSGQKGRRYDIDHGIGKMTLAKYYEKKEAGLLTDRPAIEDERDFESDSGNSSD